MLIPVGKVASVLEVFDIKPHSTINHYLWMRTKLRKFGERSLNEEYTGHPSRLRY